MSEVSERGENALRDRVVERPAGGRGTPIDLRARNRTIDTLMRRAIWGILAVCCSLGAAAPRAGGRAGAEPVREALPSLAQQPGAELRIYLMTLGPGSVIYERFGHNTIVVHDPNPSPRRVAERAAFEATLRGRMPAAPPFNTTDRAHHYGAFDFEQEGFIPHFIMGRMEYWTVSEWADLTALIYAADDRTVLLQELNLTPSQKLEIKRFLEWNELPENRFYRYDYYRDNCSTRVRDAIDRAVGGELTRQLQATPTGTTYRSHTRRLTSGLDPLDVFWFTSFSYVLGHPVDEPLSAWEECFLPVNLAEHVRRITLPDGGGGSKPLVLAEHLMASSTRPPMPAESPHRTPGYAVAGLLVGGTFYGLARLAGASRLARVGFTLVIVPWVLFWGFASTVAAWGWLATDHAASYRNENLLQMSPLILPLVILGPMLAFGRRRGARVAVVLGLIGAAGSVLGLLLKIFPAFWQHNAEIIAVALPANIGLALALIRLARGNEVAKMQSKQESVTP